MCSQKATINELLGPHASSERRPPINVNGPRIPTSSSENSGRAPVVQLLNNNVVSRTEVSNIRLQDTGVAKDLSCKAHHARDRLRSLLLPREDFVKIVSAAPKGAAAWRHMCLGGDFNEFDCDPQASPGDLGKYLMYTSILVELVSPYFDFSSLSMSIDPQEYVERCITEIENSVANDDDFASTLPGLETMVILSKWYTNMGRARKAWLITRRAIDLAQLSGIHLSTARPQNPPDSLFKRRLKLWTTLGLTDRFLGLILGLPHVIQDAYYRPQVEMRLKDEPVRFETYILRLGLIMGHLINRNQEDPSNMSLAETLAIEQELEAHAQAVPKEFWRGPTPGSPIDQDADDLTGRLMAHFNHHILRALLHMPFMLRSFGTKQFRYSHGAALESSRNALTVFNTFRPWNGFSQQKCQVLDFLAFIAAMLLIIHHLGSSEVPDYDYTQADRDWGLVERTIQVLRDVGEESRGTVAAQSRTMLENITRFASQGIAEGKESTTCKITVPYIGVITLTTTGKGKCIRKKRSNGFDPSAQGQQSHPESTQSTPQQLNTPPGSNSGDLISNPPSVSASGISGVPSSTTWAHPPLDVSRIQLENIFALPPSTPDLFGNLPTVAEGDLGLWSNLNLDFELGQGWDMYWMNDGHGHVNS